MQTLGMSPEKPGALKERGNTCTVSPALLQSAEVMPGTNPGSTSLGLESQGPFRPVGQILGHRSI